MTIRELYNILSYLAEDPYKADGDIVVISHLPAADYVLAGISEVEWSFLENRLKIGVGEVPVDEDSG